MEQNRKVNKLFDYHYIVKININPMFRLITKNRKTLDYNVT